MLVCGIKKVYEYLEKNKIEKIYLTEEFNDKDILDFIKLINKDDEIIELIYVHREDIDEMIDEDFNIHQDIVGETRNMIPFIIILIVSTFLLLFVSMGIAFSLYSDVDKIITPGPGDIPDDDGQIILNYSDYNGVGPGIKLDNARPLEDETGKNLMGVRSYFDFTVSGKTSKNKLRYYILLNKNDVSTLKDNNVKIYLTKMKGNIEEPLLDKVYKISELADKKIENSNNKVLYYVDLDKNLVSFHDRYRLRIWLSNDAENYYDQTYSINVNILGEGR